MDTIDRTLKVAACIVLFGFSVMFGFLGKATEMTLAIVAGSLGLAFLNLDKMKRFKGAGFEAEMKEKIETIIEKETEPTHKEHIADGSPGMEALVTDEKIQKVLSALFNPTYTWRYVEGICQESDLPMAAALEALNELLSNNLVTSSEGDHGTLWCLTAKGRNMFRNIESASSGDKDPASR